MKDKVRVAVIGHGHIGRWHVQKAMSLDSAELVAIIESSTATIENTQKLYPNYMVTRSLDEVIDDIDAAIIATPTITHYEIAKQLLEKDKHVFCEKPLCSTFKEALEIKKLSEGRKCLVQVGHSERFHQIWQKKEEYSQYFTGPSTVTMRRMAAFKGRATDVDVVRDLMIHDLDLLCYLFNDIPTSVQSTGYKIRTDKWDFVKSYFSFKNGLSASVVVSRNHVEEVRDIEITNEYGCLYIDLFKNNVSIAGIDSDEDGRPVKFYSYSKEDHLLIEQTHFFNSILENEDAVVGVNDGVLAVKLVDVVLKSLEEGEIVNIV